MSKSLFYKVAGFGPQKRLRHRYFLVKFTKFLGITFLQKTSGGCFFINIYMKTPQTEPFFSQIVWKKIPLVLCFYDLCHKSTIKYKQYRSQSVIFIIVRSAATNLSVMQSRFHVCITGYCIFPQLILSCLIFF